MYGKAKPRKDEGQNDKCNEDFSRTQIVCHTDAFSAVEGTLFVSRVRGTLSFVHRSF